MTSPAVRLTPSSAERWVNCPAAPRLEALNPIPPSPQAREGEIAHKLADDYFSRGLNPLTRIGEMLPQGPATEDHARGAQAFVRAVLETWDGRATLRSEFGIAIASYGIRGRIDLCYVQDRTLWVWDYKHGRSWVAARGNWQLLIYAMGAMSPYSIGGLALDDVERINLCICQPRAFDPAGPVKVWTLDRADFAQYAAIVEKAVSDIHAGRPDTCPGPHCLWCNARGICPALGRVSAAVWDYVSGSEYDPPSPEALGSELEMLRTAAEMLKARISGLEADAIGRIKRNERIPGWEMAPRLSNLNWTIPASQVADLGDLSGVDIRRPATLTPTQAIDAGVPAEIVRAVSARETNGYKLEKIKTGAEVFFNG